MKELIENLWIINFEGICYFYKKIDPSSTMDETSISNLITALLIFTKDMFGDQLNNLTLGGMNIFMQSFQNLRVVISCKKEANTKKVLKVLEEIGTKFVETYYEVLKNNFVVDAFKEFDVIVTQLLK